MFGPISGGAPLGPLFLFFSYFFSPVFLFFFFLVFIFLIFCSFLFFDFFKNFSFFIFPKEKVSCFLSSCISFKYFLMLALVSEFNCFLRSRCSMEMWCPDDIGRDSWDRVGPPARRESMIQLSRVGWRLLACENGASPDCLVVVVVSDTCESVVYVHNTSDLQKATS